MAGKRRWLVRGLWALLIVIPLVFAGLYAWNPQGARSADPRLRILGYAPMRVPSSSMEPALQPEDVLIVRTVRDPSRELQRGEIVTFRPPHDQDHTWVKRVVGWPGETVAIQDGRLLIDGQPVSEPYVEPAKARDDYSRSFPATRIPAGHYFLLGDYRDNSEDSRMMGAIPADAVVGKLSRVIRPQ